MELTSAIQSEQHVKKELARRMGQLAEDLHNAKEQVGLLVQLHHWAQVGHLAQLHHWAQVGLLVQLHHWAQLGNCTKGPK